MVLVAAGALGAAASGCDGRDHDRDHDGDLAPPPDETITASPDRGPIDTGTTIKPQAGNGVGVFVEYAAGGHWTVTTACDTSTSQDSCGFDLFVAGADATTQLTDPSGLSLQGPDTVDILADGSIHLFADTSTGLDGFAFDAPAGAAIELEAYLDGVPQPRFVYWIGKGVLHTGAPTDPFVFEPSAP
jgi:hypothetical protein